jgi:hypothetical protein
MFLCEPPYSGINMRHPALEDMQNAISVGELGQNHANAVG